MSKLNPFKLTSWKNDVKSNDVLVAGLNAYTLLDLVTYKTSHSFICGNLVGVGVGVGVLVGFGVLFGVLVKVGVGVGP
jgi:hypothetical protein